jgi:hypothetical protein
LTINGGAARTVSRQVSLTLTGAAGVTVSGMRLANDATPTGTFQSYSTTLPWTLGPIDGTRTVRLQLRDNLGNQSNTATASIILDSTAPTATITPPTSNTGPVTISFNELVTAASATNITLVAAGTSSPLPTTLTCLDASNASVSCATGSFLTIRVQPTAPLVPKASYTLTVNPSTAPKVHDLAGNNAPTTNNTFTR